MSTFLQKVGREPNVILGVVTAAVNLAVLFGWDLTVEQTAGINVFFGALVILVRQLVTPTAEVVAQCKDGDVIAGEAAALPNGTPVAIRQVAPALPVDPDAPGDAGAGLLGLLINIGVVVLIILGIVFLAQRI